MASKGLVLVTGANGYIAARTIEAFLKAGYSVRGTARSKPSTHPLFEALSEYADKLEIVEVPDITAAGAFDEAVKGVDAIAHLAAPVSLSFTDPEPVMKGAVEGSARILESANREPSVKNFVFMSSIAAVRGQKEGDYTFTEKDWNDTAEAVVAAKGKDAPGPFIYAASKTAAEKTFWKFRDDNKPHFTQTAVNPVFVAGPPLVVPETSDKIPGTTRFIWKVYTGVPLAEAAFSGPLPSYVDVRDVARIVVFGVEHPEKANGERFIASTVYAPPQAVADILRKAYPERANIIEQGTPGEGYLPGYKFPSAVVYDGSKVTRVSGEDYIPFEQTVLDTAESLKNIV
ncbi:NAD(P)-binding protein [Thozetella sp. PMI_491]|nr:NAD(P)-binding protein [Thozetella sp. PMI_491]